MNKSTKSNFFSKLYDKIAKTADYAWTGVWLDTRNNIWISLLKTINLSIKSFLNKDLQSRSMALTYSTVLSIVPALALLLAIGRGFGLQNILKDELLTYFPAQTQSITTALSFVDSYLNSASQGIFVGIGIIFLLWTMISLLNNIEQAFNKIWDVKVQRPFYRKITDYTAICLMIPILMICSSGVSIFMSTAISEHLSFLSPMVNVLLDASPLILVWVAFTLSFLLIPNTKVKFKYALLSGLICGIAFQIIQLLFVNGQIYVSKYNAIYGSFAFLPLLLIWLQLSWLILLFGALLTYSAQNVFGYNFTDTDKIISDDYFRIFATIVMAIIVKRFDAHKSPLSPREMCKKYDLPVRLLTSVIEKLHDAGLVYLVERDKDSYGIAPAFNTTDYTVGEYWRKLNTLGASGFIPRLNKHFNKIISEVTPIISNSYADADNIKISSLNLPESLA